MNWRDCNYIQTTVLRSITQDCSGRIHRERSDPIPVQNFHFEDFYDLQ